MLVIVCRKDGVVNIALERDTNAIEFTDEEIEVMGVETALLFDKRMNLREVMYEVNEAGLPEAHAHAVYS